MTAMAVRIVLPAAPAKAGDDRRIAPGVNRLVNPALILGQKDRKKADW